MRSAVFLGLYVALMVACRTAESQDELRPGRLPRDVRGVLEPGLIATFTPAMGNSPQHDARVSRMAALYVATGTPATPFMDAGPFRAELQGYLRLKLKGDYRIGATGNGRFVLHVNGDEVLRSSGDDLSHEDPVLVSLVRGHNSLRIDYTSPADGDAAFRLHWSLPDAYPESIPPDVFSHDPRDAALARGKLLREGRSLLADRRCLKCHTTGDDPLAGAGQMIELSADAPDLSHVGDRLTEPWMARWILDPQAMRTHATMPATLDSLDATKAARQSLDVAAFLGSLKSAAGGTETNDSEDDRQRGAALYETLGCIACHLTAPPEEDDLYDRVTLYSVGRKFMPGALREFLMRPHANYAWTRMPDFRLSADESQALAAYLREQGQAEIEPVVASRGGDAERGRKAFSKWGCANCHAVGNHEDVEKQAPRQLVASNSGCLAADSTARRDAPDHALSDTQREAVLALLADGLVSLARHQPAEAAERHRRQLRCVACHARDGQFDYLPEILLEESALGLPPEIVPSLTWAGEKLQAAWIERQIAGELPYRSRPWLKIRMPAFAQRASSLAHGLAAQHGIGYASEDPPELDAAAVEVGRALSQKQGGFYCLQCHGVGSQPAEGAFDIRGVNFSYVADRLRHEYYLRWMANPLQYDPATKMPVFSPDGVTTPLLHVHDGDARRQFDALWQYLHSERATTADPESR